MNQYTGLGDSDVTQLRDQARRAGSHGRIATAELARFVQDSLRTNAEPVSPHIIGHLIDTLRLTIELVDPDLAKFRGLHMALIHEGD